MKKSVIVGASCFLLGSLSAGTVAFASSNYVQALINSASITVNHTAQTNGSSLVYNGITYAQLYAIEESLKASGFGVTWDGHNFDIDTAQGNGTAGDGVNITTVNPVSVNTQGNSNIVTTYEDEFDKYHKGGFEVATDGTNSETGQPYDYVDATYNIDGQYSTLTGDIIPNNSDGAVHIDVVELTIIGDGKTLYTSGPIFTGMSSPMPVNVNVNGVKTLEIKFQDGANKGYSSMGFVDVNLK